jgi:hypothetical protein
MDVNEEGFLLDVIVQPIDEDMPSEPHEDKRRDIDHFFQPPVVKTINGKMKKYCSCKLCPYVPLTSALLRFVNVNEINSCRDKRSIVNEVTMLRCHLEAHHSVSLLLPFLSTSYCIFLIGSIPQMGSKH